MSHAEFKHIGDPIDKLVEELSELTIALMKVKRFGWFSTNPLATGPTLNNIDQVKLEMSDVVEAIEGVEQVMRQTVAEHFNTDSPTRKTEHKPVALLWDVSPIGVLDDFGDFKRAPKRKNWLSESNDKEWCKFWAEHDIYRKVYA